MFNFLTLGATILGGISQSNAASNAAAAAQRVGNFNAEIIERDVDLLDRQRNLLNNNFATQNIRKREEFRKTQGSAVTNYSYGGIDISEGTPMAVLRDNSAEFEYELAVDKLNNSVANMQISDAQEDARLSAQLSRMEGGAQAAGLRSQGRSSLIQSVGSAASYGYETGIFS